MQIKSRPQVTRPVGVVVHVATEPVNNADTPMVFGAYALLKKDGTVAQARMQEIGTAMSHSQGALAVVAQFLASLPEGFLDKRIVIYIPDGCALSLLSGETRARTPRVQELLATVRRLADQRCPRALFRYGRFCDLARGLVFVDRWA